MNGYKLISSDTCADLGFADDDTATSSEAQRVWDYYEKKRPDVNKTDIGKGYKGYYFS